MAFFYIQELYVYELIPSSDVGGCPLYEPIDCNTAFFKPNAGMRGGGLMLITCCFACSRFVCSTTSLRSPIVFATTAVEWDVASAFSALPETGGCR